MSRRFLFVGEKPSAMAEDKDIVWADGGLAAKQLFDGLNANGIDPRTCVFFNLFGDRADAAENNAAAIRRNVSAIQALSRANRMEVVAMGNKVARRLNDHGVRHRVITHPAARGAIRLKENYAAHIAEKLAG